MVAAAVAAAAEAVMEVAAPAVAELVAEVMAEVGLEEEAPVAAGRAAAGRAAVERAVAARLAAVELHPTRAYTIPTLSPGRLSRHFLPALPTTSRFSINSPTAPADLSSSTPMICWAVWNGSLKIRTSIICWATSRQFQPKEVAIV